MLVTVEKVIFLQNVDVFAEVPTEQLSHLAAIAEEVEFEAGTVIYREEEPADALYLVLEGGVRLQRGGREILLAGKNQAFGSWALFDSKPRVATAEVVQKTRLLRIDRADFVDLLADHVRITQGVLKGFTSRLRGLVGRVQTPPGQMESPDDKPS